MAHDAVTGATVPDGEWDHDDPYTYFSSASQSVLNAGDEATIPGWVESRYFSDRAQYEAFAASDKSIEEWFTDPAWRETPMGKSWTAVEEEGLAEQKIYEAGQRIQRTYQGNPSGSDGDPNTYPTTDGMARITAEQRLGKPVGQTYP